MLQGSDETGVEDCNAAEEESYAEPIYGGSSITVDGAITLIFAFVLCHCMTKLDLDDLLALLHMLFPMSSIPATRYQLIKLFSLCQGRVNIVLAVR